MKGTFIEFKPGQKYPGKNADTSDTPNSFTDCGYVLTDDDVVIDIDHLPKESIKEMIKRFNIKTQLVWTDRGVHMYFKKHDSFGRRKEGICALGFPFEMKTSKNQKAVTFKRNDICRTVENEDVRELLPWYFYPPKKFTIDMTGMDEGEGRNNALFSHRQQLGKTHEANKICHFINECVFAKPLTDQELENIVSRQPVNGIIPDTREASDRLITEFRTVVWQGDIYWHNGAEYVSDQDNWRLRKEIFDRYPDKESKFVNEVVAQIETKSEHLGSDPFPIKFRNGYIDGGNWYPFEYTEFTPYTIDVEYDPNAEPVEIVDELIDSITDHDADYRLLFLEALGYPLITDPEIMRSLAKFFFFRGNGANGKGTTLQIMKRIYGEKNCTTMSPAELEDERYVVTMVGKLCNLGDDIEPDAITNQTMKMLKNISTADSFTARRLYQQAITVQVTAKMYFTTNTEIKTYEKNYAYKRRVMWLPMFNKVEKPDPHFISKVTTPEALRYWVRLLVEGMQRIINNQSFSKCQKVAEFNEEYHKNNNHMALFLEMVDIEEDIIKHTPTQVKELYNRINDDDTKRYSPKLLEAALNEHGVGLVMRRIAGKQSRLFDKIEV